MWYRTRAKQSKAKWKVFPSINLEEQEEEIRWTRKGTFKFTEVTAHSGFQYPRFVFTPHLTSNLQAVASLFIAPTLFPPYPCACVSPSPATKGFKQALKTHTSQRVSVPQASLNWGINKTTTGKPKTGFPPQKKKFLLSYLESHYLIWNQIEWSHTQTGTHSLCTFGAF